MRINMNGSLTNGRSNGRKSPEEGKKGQVRFLVGNRIHKFPRSLLNKFPECHLAKLVAGAGSSHKSAPAVDLWEIDRSGELFELVIGLMESHQQEGDKRPGGPVQVDLGDGERKQALIRELNYYNLPSLANFVRARS